jgi:two-component system, NarL family, nitrate/nitrite response regulator NarL
MGQDPIRVMLVDDHHSMLWGLRKLIESAAPRMAVVCVATGRDDALAGVRAHEPDVLLLDLDLGEESGLDVMRELPPHGRTRVLVLTGTADPVARERALRAGARGLIHKSKRAEVILEAVCSVHAGGLWFDRALLERLHAAFCERPVAANAAPADKLTAAERRVIGAVVRHKSAPNKVIAHELGISNNTLRNHLASIYDKLALHRRVDLVLYALKHPSELAQ